jgi:glycyl-tRNA synthetase (class II)
VGHADRACYDLQVHSQKSKVPLIASQTLPEPKEVGVCEYERERENPP